MTTSCNSVVTVVGGGPAGLMAAEVLSARGMQVHVYDAMPSVGRKFLLAGKGGMNLTHAEPYENFLSRYGSRRAQIAPLLSAFDADDLRAWAKSLGIDTFVGSSNRVFPVDMKAAPLLRAWLQRLRAQGVQFHMRHRWMGWGAGAGTPCLRFATPAGEVDVASDAVVLALGGASWPRLGSDGAWLPWLMQRGVDVAPLVPANCAFEADWSAHFRERYAGHPVKPVAFSWTGADGVMTHRQGEFVVNASGIEGSLVYAASAGLRDEIARSGSAMVHIDLAPGKSLQRVIDEVAHPRGSRSLSSHLQGRVGISGVKAGLLRECLDKEAFADPARLAAAIKALPLRLRAVRPIAEAISSAGGVQFEALDAGLMARCLPGVFCAGEMLDWEAPTGGYLLTACFASGHRAAAGVMAWLASQNDAGCD
ncbi:TIGR03862 family flavoprotein [Janthinobacterium sp. 17J80-10]|uniref:TIGR03862 family flavoprotein n=1 Tax=Janthinobacterium sp. 17J80-10 TaxID=2497863 RepID=UPI0010056D60|nr:TIGR03862 family flavoprotein [Janthinobacterium sp. 17J80-10]QAU35376.1 TIGR03862 family flavoprotein [Janthinobacterium sp. 17J80-10]